MIRRELPEISRRILRGLSPSPALRGPVSVTGSRFLATPPVMPGPVPPRGTFSEGIPSPSGVGVVFGAPGGAGPVSGSVSYYIICRLGGWVHRLGNISGEIEKINLAGLPPGSGTLKHFYPILRRIKPLFVNSRSRINTLF